MRSFKNGREYVSVWSETQEAHKKALASYEKSGYKIEHSWIEADLRCPTPYRSTVSRKLKHRGRNA